MKAVLTENHIKAVERAIDFCRYLYKEEHEKLTDMIRSHERKERAYKSRNLLDKILLKKPKLIEEKISLRTQMKVLMKISYIRSDLKTIKSIIENTGQAEVDVEKYKHIETFLLK